MVDDKRVHVHIDGRVQGVGYRYFALEKALALGLVGWVRNLPNGNVEAYAQGSHDALMQWIKQLKKGPVMAHVSHLEADWNPPAAMFTTFEIR